jgi:hypothetical protein
MIDYEPGFLLLWILPLFFFILLWGMNHMLSPFLSFAARNQIVAGIFFFALLLACIKRKTILVTLCQGAALSIVSSLTYIFKEEYMSIAIFFLSLAVFILSISATVLKAERFDKGGVKYGDALLSSTSYFLSVLSASVVGILGIAAIFIFLASFLIPFIFDLLLLPFFTQEIMLFIILNPETFRNLISFPALVLGIFLASKFSFYPVISVLERKGISSLVDSWKATRRNLTKIFSILLIAGVLWKILGALSFLPGGDQLAFVARIAFVFPFTLICLTIIYLERGKKSF